MAPVVLSLQAEAVSKDSSTVDLVRRARMVASKLKLEGLDELFRHELNGYPENAELPKYRRVRGELVTLNPYNGLYIPIIVQDDSVAEMLNEGEVREPISEIEDLIARSTNTSKIAWKFGSRTERMIRDLVEQDQPNCGWIQPFRRVETTAFQQVLHSVRNEVLEWALALEREGILGEDMEFSKEEVSRAGSVSINIETIQGFQGVIGAATRSTVTSSAGAINLASTGLTEAQKSELLALLRAVDQASPQEKTGAIKRALQWANDHAALLGAALGAVLKALGDAMT